MTYFEKRVITALGELKRRDIKDRGMRDLVQLLYDMMRENPDHNFDEHDRYMICTLSLKLLPQATALVQQAKTTMMIIEKNGPPLIS